MVAVAASARAQSKVGIYLRDVFTLDLRSLAVFRVALAVVVFFDTLRKFLHVEAFFSDAGVIPRGLLRDTAELAMDTAPELVRVSIHGLFGSLPWQFVLFGLTLAAAVVFGLGYKTRWANAVLLLLVISQQLRNPILLNSADDLLRLLLVWSLFLPLAVRKAPSRSVLSIASAGFVVQVFVLYFFSFLMKTDPSWRSDGTAIYYALMWDQLSTPLGKVLLRFPTLCYVLTFGTCALEAMGPLLLFVPRPRLRAVLVAVFVSFHLAMNLTLHLGHFSYVCMLAWLPLVPGWVWERLGWTARAAAHARESFLSPAVHRFAAVPLVLMLVINVAGLREFRKAYPDTSQTLIHAVALTGMDQRWGMFSPAPRKEGGWFVFPGRTRDGSTVNAWTGGPFTWDKPASSADIYPSILWEDYLLHLYFNEDERLWAGFSRWICDGARSRGGSELESFDVVMVAEKTPLPGEPRPPAERRPTYSHVCTQGAR